MTDNELIAAIISTLEPYVQAKFGATYEFAQKNQPELQGTPSTPVVYLEKLFDKRYGWVRRDVDMWTPATGPTDTTISTKDVQLYETTFQFSALVLQDPSDLTIPTASDLVNYVSMLLGTAIILAALRQKGANVQRSTSVRNPYWVDDFDRFEASPSFDIVLQHHRDLDLTVPEISAVEVRVYSV